MSYCYKLRMSLTITMLLSSHTHTHTHPPQSNRAHTSVSLCMTPPSRPKGFGVIFSLAASSFHWSLNPFSGIIQACLPGPKPQKSPSQSKVQIFQFSCLRFSGYNL